MDRKCATINLQAERLFGVGANHKTICSLEPSSQIFQEIQRLAEEAISTAVDALLLQVNVL